MEYENFGFGRCNQERCDNYGERVYKEDWEIGDDGIPHCPKCHEPLEFPQPSTKAKTDFKKIGIILAAIIIVVGIVIGVILGIKAINRKKMIDRVAKIESMEQARKDSIQAAEQAQLAAEQERIRLAEEVAAEADRLEAEAAAAAEQARLAEEEAKAAKKATSGTIDYGKWSGSWKGGKPHGTGTMKYTKERLIDSRDPQKRVATPGDYIIGEFANGKLVQGVWYDSANNVKGSIIIGM